MKRKRLYSFLVLLIVMMALLGCGAKADTGYTNISVSQLETMIGEKDFLLINTHIPEEGDILGTDLFIPFNDIEGNLSLLPEDKDAKLVVYCRSGNMSTSAAEELVSRGYTNVFELDGGFNAWNAAGLPFE